MPMSKSGKSAYFLHVFVIILLAHFVNSLNESEISMKFCVFDTHIEFCKKKFVFAHIST
jgi:hypothetical protein